MSSYQLGFLLVRHLDGILSYCHEKGGMREGAASPDDQHVGGSSVRKA